MSGALIDLRDAAGRAVVLELTINRVYVECVLDDRCYAVFDRDGLRRWLADPAGIFSCDEMCWYYTDHDDVAVILDGRVPFWPLPAHVIEDLRSRI